MNLSVFFPAYNEEGNIKNTVNKALAVCKHLEGIDKFEIIVVDDGSKDATGKIADSLAKENTEIKVIHHEKNRGYGAALKTGLYNSKYEWIVFTDSDGQFDFAEVTKFINKAKRQSFPPHSPTLKVRSAETFKVSPAAGSPDLICGYKIKRADPFIRKLNSKLWALLMRILFGLKLRDRACGFKMIRKEVIETIPKLETDGAVAEDELLIKAKRAGFTFAEVPVHHYPRSTGQQTGADPFVILKAFRELWYLWGVLG